MTNESSVTFKTDYTNCSFFLNPMCKLHVFMYISLKTNRTQTIYEYDLRVKARDE